jgi:anti-sigma regulatory factor (Ser/Thr protein kinase)
VQPSPAERQTTVPGDFMSTPGPPPGGVFLDRDEFAPGTARRYLRAVLSPTNVTSGAVDTAVQVVSEIVTNAFLHGTNGKIHVVSEVTGDLLVTIRVADDTPYDSVKVPAAADPGRSATSGRGLFLVEHFSLDWGHGPVDGDPSSGTAVWAQLDGKAP